VLCITAKWAAVRSLWVQEEKLRSRPRGRKIGHKLKTRRGIPQQLLGDFYIVDLDRPSCSSTDQGGGKRRGEGMEGEGKETSVGGGPGAGSSTGSGRHRPCHLSRCATASSGLRRFVRSRTRSRVVLG
jgi:hypothetical protein